MGSGYADTNRDTAVHIENDVRCHSRLYSAVLFSGFTHKELVFFSLSGTAEIENAFFACWISGLTPLQTNVTVYHALGYCKGIGP